jgi:hypothetical protein
MFADQSYLYAGTNRGGAFRTTDGGTTWSAINTGLPYAPILSFAGVNAKIFAAAGESGVFASSDNGEHWFPVDSSLSDYDVHALASNGTTLFAGARGGVFLSTDDGVTWTRGNHGMMNDPYLHVDALCISGATLYCGNQIGQVFLSKDGGMNWSQIGTGFTGSYISSLTVSGTNLFAGSDKSVALSSNSEPPWKIAYSGETYVQALSVAGTNLFVGMDGFFGGGIFLLRDAYSILRTPVNSDWKDVSAGLAGQHISSLVVSDSCLYAGTVGQGVWRRPLSEMIGDSHQSPQYLLYQNYPNPFNDQSVIRFEVRSVVHSTLKVYNLLGSEVATLLDDWTPAGWYECNFKPKNLASGVYFYKLQAGNFVQTRKLLVLR